MALPNDWIERHLHDACGHTGNTYYMRLISRTDSKIWNPNSKEMKAVGSITWANSVTLLVEEGTTGVFPVVMSKDVPADTYDIIVYKQLGGAPANTDDIEKQWEVKVGDIFGF